MINNLYQKYLDANQIISIDSRNIPQGCMFFALKGDYFDGNKFADDALRKGASCAVIDNSAYRTKGTILVDDVLSCLQQLANYHRKISTFKVIGLTGTNGKTTTKELLRIILSEVYKCSATRGNLNNHIGVPLTILSTPVDTEFLIVEMGANHQGEIAELCEIAEPDVGLITNIGRAHLEGFGCFEGVVEAKSELYKYLKKDKRTIFVNSNDDILRNLTIDCQNLIKYGEVNTTCYLKNVDYSQTLSLEIVINGKTHNAKTQLFGNYNADNILAATCVGNYFNIPPENIIKAVEAYKAENNRSQIKKTANNTLILDSYNANPSSMNSALNSFEKMIGDNKVVILGEMKELGNESITEHNKIIEFVKKLKLRNYYFIGEEFSKSNTSLKNYYPNTQDFIKELETNPIFNSIIFIKGSRANRLEDIVDYL